MAIAGAAQIRRADTEPGLQARFNFLPHMIRIDDVLVVTPQITPTEARMVIIASWKAVDPMPPPVPALRIEGKVIGPRCEYAETLITRLPYRSATMLQSLNLKATVQILEPCFWEPAHPFCYEVQLELHDEQRLLDMRHIVAGIRHLAIDGSRLELNGQDFFLSGVRHTLANTIEELEAWHHVNCSAWLTTASEGMCDRTDRWGPMLLHLLPTNHAAAAARVVMLRNHASLLMWVVPERTESETHEGLIQLVRRNDHSRLVGQLCTTKDPNRTVSAADVLLLRFDQPEDLPRTRSRPWIALCGDPNAADECTPEEFTDRFNDWHGRLGSIPGLVGIIL
jgi:hypothetical protein